jgi:hypothetical protein
VLIAQRDVQISIIDGVMTEGRRGRMHKRVVGEKKQSIHVQSNGIYGIEVVLQPL